MENNEFLTESQTLAYAGIDRNILTRFCETGYIKTKMLANGQVLYSKSEIERVFGKRREALGAYESPVQTAFETTSNSQIEQNIEQKMVANMGGVGSFESNPNNINSYGVNNTVNSHNINTSNINPNVTTNIANSNVNNSVNSNDFSAQNDSARLIKFPQNNKYYENSKQNVSNNYQNISNASSNVSMSNISASQQYGTTNGTVNHVTNSTVVKEPIFNEQVKQEEAFLNNNTSNSINKNVQGDFNFDTQDLLKTEQSSDNSHSKRSFEQHNANLEQVKKLQGEVENLKQEIVKLQSYARLQKKLLEVKEKEISELKQEKDWLKNRIESQEEKNNRDQLLILSETRVIHNLIASNQKASPIRAALEWFGFAKKNRTETIDMVKQ